MLIYGTPNNVMIHIKLQRPPVLLLRAAYKTLEVAAIFQNLQSELLRKKIVDVISSVCLTKDTAVPQKCQQNVSKIAQRHEYRLSSAATKVTTVYRYNCSLEIVSHWSKNENGFNTAREKNCFWFKITWNGD